MYMEFQQRGSFGKTLLFFKACQRRGGSFSVYLPFMSSRSSLTLNKRCDINTTRITHLLRSDIKLLQPGRLDNSYLSTLTIWGYQQKKKICLRPRSSAKSFAPGEARTHGLQIMRLTRCLLRYGGTMMAFSKLFLVRKMFVPTGGLEPPIFGLGDRRLIHQATRAPVANKSKSTTKIICVARESNPGRKNGNLA